MLETVLRFRPDHEPSGFSTSTSVFFHDKIAFEDSAFKLFSSKSLIKSTSEKETLWFLVLFVSAKNCCDFTTWWPAFYVLAWFPRRSSPLSTCRAPYFISRTLLHEQLELYFDVHYNIEEDVDPRWCPKPFFFFLIGQVPVNVLSKYALSHKERV